jgi:hypothetical protein
MATQSQTPQFILDQLVTTMCFVSELAGQIEGVE